MILAFTDRSDDAIEKTSIDRSWRRGRRRSLILRSILGIGLFFGLSPQAHAQQAIDSATAMIKDLYQKYYVGSSHSVNPSTDIQLMHKYFSPSMANILIRDKQRADRRQESGCLDWDPFINGQDYDPNSLSNLEVLANATRSGVNATATWGDRGPQTKIVYKLIRVSGRWVIDDIIENNRSVKKDVESCLRGK